MEVEITPEAGDGETAEVVEDTAEAIVDVAEAVAEAVADVAETVAEAVAEAVGDTEEGETAPELHERVALLEERMGSHEHGQYATHEDARRIAEEAFTDSVLALAALAAEPEDVAPADDDITVVEPDVAAESPGGGSFLKRIW